MAIWVYAKDATDFTGNGLGELRPSECVISERANGEYELMLRRPIGEDELEREKWKRVERGTIISAPVPVRTMPEIIDAAGTPQVVSELEIWTVAQNVKTRQRPAANAKAIRVLRKGEKWVVTLKQGSWFKGRDGRGRAGWVPSVALEYAEHVTTPAQSDAIEKAAPAAFSSQQLFRVYRPMWTNDAVSVYARHISYDFARNLTRELALNFADGYTAISALTHGLYETGGDFECFTDIYAPAGSEGRKAINWTRVNPIKALFDPDIGFCETFKAEAVRDNFTIYLLANAGLDRGFHITYGKNMTGIQWEENEENVITRLIPIGQNMNGTTLLLPEEYVDSPRVSEYPMICCDTLEVTGAKVGDRNEAGQIISAAMAYDMMRAAAAEKFAQGADQPEITLKVDFVRLGDTEEYKQFSGMSQAFMHDVIHVRHPRLGITLDAKVVATKWDAIRQRYLSLEIGTGKGQMKGARVAGWQVKQLDGSKIRDGTIQTKALTSAGVASGQLRPDSVTAGIIAAGAVGDKHVTDGALNQAKINGLPAALDAIRNRLDALEA